MKHLIALFIGLIFFGNLFVIGSSGQNLKLNSKTFNDFIDIPNSLNQRPSTDLRSKFNGFINRANENGKIRVIIGLKLENYQSDAALNAFQQTEQRAEIKQKQAAILRDLSNFFVGYTRQFDYIPFIAIEIGADALTFLCDSSDIISIEEDEPQKPALLQSIPMIGGSAPGGATGGTFSGFSGQGRTVAIIDSGVDKTHPFFNGRVVSEACYSANSSSSTSLCPGGVNSSTASGSGINCNVNQFSTCTHGTHVAGIAAGGHPQITGNGVARNANIIALQVFSSSTSCGTDPAPCLRSNTSDTIAALERVYTLRTTFNIDAVNMSLGGGQYTSFCDTEQSGYKTIIDNLRSANIASVVASGNNGYHDALSSPACISSAVSVGSVNDGDVAPPDNISTFSNGAVFLNLLAPGEVITSSVPGGIYENSQGTSQAAPHVAGAFAVVRQKFPSDSVTQTLTRLRYGGILVLDQNNGSVKPRIQVNFALTTSNVDPCSLPAPISFGQTINTSLALGDCLIPTGLTDVYSFSASQGQQIAITQTSTAFDTFLYLQNSAGTFVAFDNNGGGGTNSRIPANGGFFTIPATGTYTILTSNISFFPSPTGNYSVSLINGTSCNFTVSSGSQNFAAAGGNGNFNVTTASGCAWTAQSSAAWLTTTSTGNGNGTVNYSVAGNPTTTARTATITTGGQVHTVTQAGAIVTTTHRPYDFDGDGKSDISIFRPSNGQWWYQKSSNGGNAAFAFGSATDKLVPGDYTGDGKTDIAFFRPSNGQWFILRSEDNSFFSFPFGANGDIPAPADFDGDGKTDAAVFRPSNTTWYIQRSSDGGTTIQGFGLNGDKPTVADYDGDGKADLAIFRPSNGQWWTQRSTNGSVYALAFGLSTDKPVQGDYTGDGKADVAFFRPSSGEWFILRSEDFSFFAFPFGAAGDIPAPGDYDGDGKFDATIFRPSNVTWYSQRSTAGTLIVGFGISGDQPIPNVFVP